MGIRGSADSDWTAVVINDVGCAVLVLEGYLSRSEGVSDAAPGPGVPSGGR